MSEKAATPAESTTTAVEAKIETTAAAAPAANAMAIQSTPAEKAEVPNNAAKVEAQTETKKDESKPDAVAVVPEKYELKLGKDSLLDASDVAKVEALAKASGLSNEQAQARLAEREEAKTAFFEQQKETLKTVQATWVSEIATDKEFGGKAFKENAEYAKRAVDQFADDAFKKALNDPDMQWGNNPHLFRTFARIGKLIAEDKLVEGKAGASQKDKRSTEEKLYGNTHKQS